MKKWMCLLLASMLLLTGCSLLPGEEESSTAEEQNAVVQIEDDTESAESEAVVASESSKTVEEESEASALEEDSEVLEEEQAEITDPEMDYVAQRVEEILSGMTLEEKVGQMFLARMPDSAAYYAETYQLGGYVLFDVDFNGYSQEEVIERIDSCQAVSKIPMIMSVDEEGGTVTRVSDYFRDSRFMSPRDVYAEGGWSGIVSDTIEKCELLKELHLNMNLAPVCDLADDYGDFMYDRSFSGDAQEAANFIGWTISTMNQQGIGSGLWQ